MLDHQVMLASLILSSRTTPTIAATHKIYALPTYAPDRLHFQHPVLKIERPKINTPHRPDSENSLLPHTALAAGFTQQISISVSPPVLQFPEHTVLIN
jgi:hypothetical protein